MLFFFYRYFRALMIIPMPWEIFPVIWLIWSFQFTLLSIITPRNFLFMTSLMHWPLVLNGVGFFAHFLPGKIHILSFFTFNDSLLTFNQVDISFNSPFYVFCMTLRSVPVVKRFTLSANKIGKVFLQTSYWYRLKKKWTEDWALWYPIRDKFSSWRYTIECNQFFTICKLTRLKHFFEYNCVLAYIVEWHDPHYRRL